VEVVAGTEVADSDLYSQLQATEGEEAETEGEEAETETAVKGEVGYPEWEVVVRVEAY